MIAPDGPEAAPMLDVVARRDYEARTEQFYEVREQFTALRRELAALEHNMRHEAPRSTTVDLWADRLAAILKAHNGTP